jgi:4-oxalocrotonate tautomerase
MPFARITVAGFQLDRQQKETLAAEVAALVVRALRKDPTRTAALVEEAAAPAASVGGAPAPRLAHIEVIVTAGTNSPAEKAGFLEGADALLRRALGPLPEATYVVVREVPADAWGFAGRTQAARKTASSG